MNVSPAGVLLVKDFEGFVDHAYRDVVGVWTIGYGHTEGVHPGQRITEAQASALLERDLDKHYAPAVRALNLPLGQHQFDALVSFVYNVGPGGVASSTHVGQALRAHHWREAGDFLLQWDKAGGHAVPGLTRRRRAERELFLSTDHSGEHLQDYTNAERQAIRDYDRLVRAGRGHGPDALHLRAVMTRQRKRVWAAAQGSGGWRKANRRARYHSLLIRTR